MRVRSLSIAVLLAVIAAGARLYKLGEWPLWMDEPATMEEVNSLFGQSSEPPDSQIYRLPRLIPVGHILIGLGTWAFGSGEFGIRIGAALMGIATVPLVFLLLERSLGRAAAISAALLIALWPAHVVQSQYARFYTVAAFFASASLLTGALATRERSTGRTIVACLALNLAILSHTITLLLLPVMMVAILGAIYLEDRKLHWPILAVFGLTAVLDALLYLLYLRPLLQGWNKGADWYTVGHSVLASVNMLGWVVSLLAPLGVGLIWFRERGQAWYWTVSGAGWVGAALVLPIVMSYHPAYVFPMALAAIVPAAYGVASTYELSRGVGKVAGAGLIGIAALSGLPSLASHFADGTRPDMRTAAGYVAAHCRPGDRVATYRLVVFRIYAKSCEPATDIPLGNEAIPKLTQLIREPGRLWIVVDSTRGGIPEGLREWLSEHARHQVRVQRRRFDYFENTMDVFLVSPLS